MRRLKDNTSDKFLDIVQTVDLEEFFGLRPTIRAIVTAGEKVTGVIASMAGVALLKTGEVVRCACHGHEFDLYRMPSSSCAYLLSLDSNRLNVI